MVKLNTFNCFFLNKQIISQDKLSSSKELTQAQKKQLLDAKKWSERNAQTGAGDGDNAPFSQTLGTFPDGVGRGRANRFKSEVRVGRGSGRGMAPTDNWKRPER